MFFGAFIDRVEKVGACEGGGAGGEVVSTYVRKKELFSLASSKPEVSIAHSLHLEWLKSHNSFCVR